MDDKRIKLICTAATFCSGGDEWLFSRWINKISSIVEFDDFGKNTYLYTQSNVIPNDDLKELQALLLRYEIDTKQLEVFLNEKNKECLSVDSIFGYCDSESESLKHNFVKENIVVACESVQYYSEGDKDTFFEWLKKIPAVIDFKGVGETLYIYIKDKEISKNDLYELLALFYRYNIKNAKQLSIFLNEKNKEWFFDNTYAFWHKKVFVK
ncbi:hypothetical protein KAH94_02930 [bacterium]|nr:hypothetical protein [bacterium]